MVREGAVSRIYERSYTTDATVNPLFPHDHVVQAAGSLQVSHAPMLTPRERQLVVLLCRGHANGQIARHLGVSEGTVKVHLHNIYGKLGVANRTSCAAFVVTHWHRLGLPVTR
jgi:two-component system nitrate/nitrite response regulator NarL